MEDRRQNLSGSLSDSVSLFNDGQCFIIVETVDHDVANGQLLKCNLIVCGNYPECLSDSEEESILQSRGKLVLQRPQSTGQGATGLLALSTELPADRHGSLLQILKLPLSRGVRSLKGIFRDYLIRDRQPQC